MIFYFGRKPGALLSCVFGDARAALPGTLPPVRLPFFFAFLAAFAVLTGCGGTPSSRRLADDLKSCASWAATAQLIGESWLSEAIPRAYAGDSLSAGREEISTAIETARRAGRADAVAPLQELEKSLTAMADAVGRQDRAALRAQLASLAEQKENLAALEKSLASVK